MTAILGPLAAFTSAVTWAFGSVRYAQASRTMGGAYVNLLRGLLATGIYTTYAFARRGTDLYVGVDLGHTAWLLGSIVGSYAVGDNVFLAAASRAGLSTALSIGCTYPLWAALAAALWGGEPFGPQHALGTLLAIGGVIALVRMQGHGRAASVEKTSPGRRTIGVMLAVLTSGFWALNSYGVKRGAAGLPLDQANAIRFGMSLFLLAPQAFLMRRPDPQASILGGWRRLVPVALAEVLVGSVTYVYGISNSPLAVGATLSSLAPVISLPIAIMFGEERWDWRRAMAVGATTLGVVVLVTA